jgi:hypothetical protein
MVLPGRDVSFEQFQADEAACREVAAQGAVRGGDAQERYDVAYVQCMYAKGNKVPVATRGSELSEHASAPRAQVPPPPAGMPPAPPPRS